VEPDVTPEPPAGEREALAQALRGLLAARDGSPGSAWWREGVRENVDDEEPADP
jgi:hypothetical protein